MAKNAPYMLKRNTRMISARNYSRVNMQALVWGLPNKLSLKPPKSAFIGLKYLGFLHSKIFIYLRYSINFQCSNSMILASPSSPSNERICMGWVTCRVTAVFKSCFVPNPMKKYQVTFYNFACKLHLDM